MAHWFIVLIDLLIDRFVINFNHLTAPFQIRGSCVIECKLIV
jgi:hypothetical protein